MDREHHSEGHPSFCISEPRFSNLAAVRPSARHTCNVIGLGMVPGRRLACRSPATTSRSPASSNSSLPMSDRVLAFGIPFFCLALVFDC